MSESPTSAARPRRRHSARGRQARRRLKQAALECLEELGYHRMRVADVTRRAGVATGLFYHYFSDLKTLVVEVLEEFLARFEDTAHIERNIARGDWFGRILAHYTQIVSAYARHPGLMRCITQLTDEDAEFRALWRRSYQRQLKQLVVVMPRLFPESRLSDAQNWLMVYALGDIGEGLLREYYIEHSPEVRRFELSEEEMAEWLAVVFYRGLFLVHPPAERLRHSRRILAIGRDREAVTAS